jgi:phosphonate transport system substrate-binding protein
METIENKIFRLIYVYAQEDREMRDKLAQYIRFHPQVEEWREDNILAGGERLEEIRKNMASADIILLLLSADFLASYESIWQLALDLHRSNKTRIIPIYLRYVILPPDLKVLQTLPRNGIPINEWNAPDKAYAEIAQEVDKVIQEIHAGDSNASSKGSIIPLVSDKLPSIQQTSSVTMSRRNFLIITGLAGLIGATVGTFGYRVATSPKTLQDIRMIFNQAAIPSGLVDPSQLVNALHQKSGLPVHLEFHTNSYGEGITRFGNREFNVLWCGDYSYVIAKARYGVRPILQRKSQTLDRPHYYGYILTKRSSNIHTIADLKGRSLSLVDQYSTSGYLYPRHELQKNGLDENEVKTTYVGTHAKSIEFVISGNTDAGAVSEELYKSDDGSYISDVYRNTLSKYNVKDEDIVSIYRSEPIPTGPMVVHADMLEGDVWRLQNAFLLLDDPTLLRSLGISGFGSVTDAVYDPVRNVARELGIDLSTI